MSPSRSRTRHPLPGQDLPAKRGDRAGHLFFKGEEQPRSFLQGQEGQVPGAAGRDATEDLGAPARSDRTCGVGDLDSHSTLLAWHNDSGSFAKGISVADFGTSRRRARPCARRRRWPGSTPSASPPPTGTSTSPPTQARRSKRGGSMREGAGYTGITHARSSVESAASSIGWRTWHAIFRDPGRGGARSADRRPARRIAWRQVSCA